MEEEKEINQHEEEKMLDNINARRRYE